MRWIYRAGPNLDKSKILTWLAALGFLGLTAPVMAQCDKRIVAYYAYWDQPGYTSANIPMTEVTHIEHAFITLNTATNDGTLSVDPTFLEPALNSRAHAAGVKVLVSVGGSGAGQGTAFELVSANAVYRSNFANNLFNFCKTNGYDGVDIDYEFPLTTTDESNLTLMMQAIRAVFPSPTWLISMATSAMGNNTWDGAYYMNLNALQGVVDFFNVMDYDFYGGWDTNSGHLAPQYQNPADPEQAGSFKTSLDWYLSAAGISPSKINAGMPFYADEFTSVNALWINCGGDCPVVDQNYGTFVKPRLNAMGYTVQWDPTAQANYLTGSDFITYESVASAANKTAYALGTRGVGGMMIWEISQDYDGTSQDLLKATYNAYVSQCPMNSPTSTFTATATMTATVTNTATDSTTPSATASPTPTNTKTTPWTSTSTNTATTTHTPVPPTNTPTNTFTSTNTYTSTRTNTPVPPSSTPTWTSSSTRTFTATSTHTAIPPTSTPTFIFTNTPANTFSPTSTFTPTATNTTTGTFTSTASYTPTASYTFTAKPILTSTATGTATPSQTLTWTLSFTSTPSHTPTSTQTFSPTPTLSPTATHTATESFTSTASFTPTQVPGHVSLYPNPVTGSTVNILPPNYFGVSNVRVQVFTLGFRKIIDLTYDSLSAGTPISLELVDRSGSRLSNGVYYVVVIVEGQHFTAKLLVLR
jgi:GH18 family chitinase